MNNVTRKVKRYSNRKLYDTSTSSYVNLNSLAEYIRKGENVIVVDNDSERDITAETLTQLIFQQQKRSKSAVSVELLMSVIRQTPEDPTKAFAGDSFWSE
ncbi:hypothetical protein EBU95_03915 [bacterium]|nr:hypothetical protein [bacterium]